jgi:hypothetical protein
MQEARMRHMLQCRMNPSRIKAGGPDQQRMAVKQKWLFSAAPIILNGPIHQANDIFGKPQERRDERSQHEIKAARFLVVARRR